MKVLFATENESKKKRFEKDLLNNGIELITINDLNDKLDIVESGCDAIENALIKARAYSKICNYSVFAMDDNLYIENIPKELQPGVNVRRVNGKRLTDEEMIEYYSNLAKCYGNGKLTAKWVYAIAIVNKEKEYTYSWYKDDFYIVDKPSNVINKGYPLNTISINKKLNKYFTDITLEDKETIKEDESDVIKFLCKKL